MLFRSEVAAARERVLAVPAVDLKRAVDVARLVAYAVLVRRNNRAHDAPSGVVILIDDLVAIRLRIALYSCPLASVTALIGTAAFSLQHSTFIGLQVDLIPSPGGSDSLVVFKSVEM